MAPIQLIQSDLPDCQHTHYHLPSVIDDTLMVLVGAMREIHAHLRLFVSRAETSKYRMVHTNIDTSFPQFSQLFN